MYPGMTSPQIECGRPDQAGGWSNQPRRTRRANGDRGVALVEFALVFPILAMLLVGTITGGFALNQKQQVTHATREGARYAASISPTQSFSNGTWAENVRDLVIERSVGDLTAAQVC